MSAHADRKAVLVTRRTRLQDLLARHHTLAQARFYVEHLGADFSDYLREDEAYRLALGAVSDALVGWGRHQVIERGHLPNFSFAADDIVLALGQDGLVANTMKYLAGQPLLGIERREIGGLVGIGVGKRGGRREVEMVHGLGSNERSTRGYHGWRGRGWPRGLRWRGPSPGSGRRQMRRCRAAACTSSIRRLAGPYFESDRW